MNSQIEAGGPRPPGRPAAALSHPLRAALLGLLARRATVTATEAARELGESSGACSFHLRQLARYGQVEEVPGHRGRSRPWRLPAASVAASPDEEFGALARELENEGYRRWLAVRAQAPDGWRDEAFSTIVYLTPAELAEAAAAVRAVIAELGRRRGPAGDGPDVLPVAVVARMFPLLPAGPDT